MAEDARARVVRGAHRTLGGAGVRFRAVGWAEPPLPGADDANIRIVGEVDLVGGRARVTTTLPKGGGCVVVGDMLVAKVFALPVVGARIERWARADVGDEDLLTWTAVEPAARALQDLVRLLDVDAARDEGEDEHGRRLRFRTAGRDGLVTRVSWGWAWLDGDGAVCRVLGTLDDQPRARWPFARDPARHRTWMLLELSALDEPVVVAAEGPDAPSRPRDA